MRPKSGLHKRISSIFDGVTVPGGNPAGPGDPRNPATGSVDSGGYGYNRADASDNGMPSGKAAVSGSGEAWMVDSASGRGERPRKGKVVVVGILAIIFVAVLGMVLVPPASSRAQIRKTDEEKIDLSSRQSPAAISWPMPEPYPADIRNPMTIVIPEKTETKVEEPVQKVQLVIRGVVLGANSNTAIVGSEIVSVGDSVQGSKVVRIDRNQVEFEKDGQRWVQTVNPD